MQSNRQEQLDEMYYKFNITNELKEKFESMEKMFSKKEILDISFFETNNTKEEEIKEE